MKTRLWFAKTEFPRERGLLQLCQERPIWPWEGRDVLAIETSAQGVNRDGGTTPGPGLQLSYEITHIFTLKLLTKFLLRHHNCKYSLDLEQEGESDPDQISFSFWNLSKCEPLILDSCICSLASFRSQLQWLSLPMQSKWPCPGTSLVVQWLRLVFPMQGTGFRSLIRELDPTCTTKNSMLQLKILMQTWGSQINK